LQSLSLPTIYFTGARATSVGSNGMDPHHKKEQHSGEKEELKGFDDVIL
jgi:hypothetical protein